MDALRRELRRLRRSTPGTRFTARYRRHRTDSRLQTAGWLAFGVVLLGVGAAMLVLPGPGILVAVLGVAAVVGRSQRLSALLDRFEIWLREAISAAARRWRRSRHKASLASSAIFAAAMLVAGAAWLVL